MTDRMEKCLLSMIAVYDDDPDRVRWCAAEKDLWKNYRLSFDNEFMRFIHVGPNKYLFFLFS